jgi:hypothetical protein
MKKLAITLMYGAVSVVLGADGYTIQTISALKESSITPAFEKQVKKSALPSDKVKEGACNIVTVGHYGSAKEAKADLSKAKKIAKDAFVRPVSRTTPKACKSAPVAQKKSMVKSDVNGTVSSVQPIVQGGVVESPKEAVALAPAPQCPPCPAPEKETAVQVIPTNITIYDRNLARKSDIHEAIEYYKNSPYYSFRSIGLPR